MAKKSVKKKVSRKVVKKKPVQKKKAVRKSSTKKSLGVKPVKRKIGVALSNLILFAILFIFSFILYAVSTQEIYVNLFLMLSILFGFVLVAFIIVYMIFFFIKITRKK